MERRTMATILQQIHPRRWVNGLWRNPDFVKLWGSLTIVHFGGHITFLALPLTAALMLNATPFEVGVLTALEALPYPLFGLFAGVLVDRASKLPVIIWADLGRGLALASVPACAWLGVLSMPVLYLAGFLVGVGSVIGWPAYQVFMTERVGRENLVEANAKIGISDSASQLVGPGLAGALIQWLTAPIAILLDALSFVASAWMLRGIPPAATDAPKISGESVWREIGEGLVAVWRNRTLRALAWSLAAWQVFRHAYVAVVILFAARELGFSAGHVGVLFMAAGLGSLAAAGAVAPLNARYGFGPTMLVALGGTGIAWLVLGAASGDYLAASATFGLGLFLLDFSAMTFFINYLTLRQTVTPDRLLGRVTATMICLTVATAPLGGLAGGWIAEHWGLRATILLAGAGAILMIPLVAWTSPLARMRTLPTPQEPVVPESVAEEMAG
ncbi:MAG TPA: MFS transporter [Usitatibacteraceae bacterium]|nr:MFS transporter [Usitatibacteraceae bacterium]